MLKIAKYCIILLLFACSCGCALSPNVEPVPPAIKPYIFAEEFLKWERVRKYENADPTFMGAKLNVNEPGFQQRWAELYAAYADKGLWEKLVMMNKVFNQWPYVEDMDVWGLDDYWSTPAEFIQHSGDCEDYAITKYYALKALGVPPQDMCIGVVWNRRRGEAHAVLLAKVNDQYYILDNFDNEIKLRSEAWNYMPLFYINEFAVWRHTTDSKE